MGKSAKKKKHKHTSKSEKISRDRSETRHKRKKERRRSGSSELSPPDIRREKRSQSPSREVRRKNQRRFSASSRSSESDSDSRSRSRSPNHQSKKRKTRSKSPSLMRKTRSKSPSQTRMGRSRSSSISSGDSSSPVRRKDVVSKLTELDRRKTTDIQRIREERRNQKEVVKATETAEEKRARRMAKKEAKERTRKQKMGWDNDYLDYTNTDNPFGDEHLLESFQWAKKIDKDGNKSLLPEDLHKLQRQKMQESKRELEKVKKRRLEREREMEERDKERERLQREKEVEYFREWEKQEDTFHLQQAKMRSKIRIQDGRAKPIDLLAKYISAEDDDLSIEMHEPYTYLYGLTITDLEDLLEDIKVYLELEEGKNADYWRDIITITDDELNKLRKLDLNSRDFRDRREGINQSVSSEVAGIFKGKSTNQLLMLEDQIKKKLQGGEGVDLGYWESLLQQLKAHMARTRLRERHQEVLRQKLFKLKQEQGIESTPLFPAGIPRMDDEDTRAAASPVTVKDEPMDQDPEPGPSFREPEPGTSHQEPEPGTSGEGDEPLITEEDLEEEEEEEGVDEYEAGGYSPKLLQIRDLEIDAVAYEEDDDIKKLEVARQQVQTSGKVRLDGETEFEKKAREGMNDEEAQFSVEVPIEQQAFLWSDKYRPRKPRFFNRVHTGFEWNKYNQTHYDIDNPPPKIVQGYKFNIFYPDLIDKANTPEYFLTPIDDNPDFAVLKFHAGPPYEDIAFKIVNREWEYSYKRGFRCQFQNNIFQLWFHFKRYRYRR